MNAADTVLLMTAWLTGLAGSGHCLGMCGGIAGAFGVSGAGRERRLVLLVLMHLGRALGYGIIGALAAGLGAAAGGALLGGGGQASLRVLAGALTILIGCKLLLGGAWLGGLERRAARAWRYLAPTWRSLLPVSSWPRALLAGVLWGWLPCGLVYAELSVAATTGSVPLGAAVMIAFGVGTALSLGALSAFLTALGLNRVSQRWSGALLIIFGAWVVLAALAGAEMHLHSAHLHPA